MVVGVERENHGAAKPVRLDVVGLAADALLVLVRQPLGAGRQVRRTGGRVVGGLHEIVVALEPADVRVGHEAYMVGQTEWDVLNTFNIIQGVP